MKKVRITIVAASLLTLAAAPASGYALTDWQQNAWDTLGIILVALSAFMWLLVGIETFHLAAQKHLDSTMERIAAESKPVMDASRTLHRLHADDDTVRTIPYIIRFK